MKKIIITFLTMLILASCGNNNQAEIKNEEIVEKNYKILALGDSLTAGYNIDISESYPYKLEQLLNKNGNNFEVINAGVSGDTSKNLISRLNLYTEDYDIVLLNIGGNDGLRSLSLEELEKNIITIIDNFPNSEIVLFSVDLPGNYGLLYRNKLKDVYKNVLEQRDVYSYGLFFEGLDYPGDFLSDGLHPNGEGYSIIAENVYEYLLKNKLIKND